MTATEYVLKQIDEARQTAVDFMVSGACKDYAEYRKLVGKLEGLAYAESQLLYTQRKQLEQDDD